MKKTSLLLTMLFCSNGPLIAMEHPSNVPKKTLNAPPAKRLSGEERFIKIKSQMQIFDNKTGLANVTTVVRSSPLTHSGETSKKQDATEQK